MKTTVPQNNETIMKKRNVWVRVMARRDEQEQSQRLIASPLRQFGQSIRWAVRHGAIALVAVVLVGCGENLNPSASNEGDERPTVVTTSTMITDWTGAIAGDEIDLNGLLDAGADPHIYEPIPQDTQAIEDADLIIYNGYDLEPGLIRLIEATGIDAARLAVAETVVPLDLDYDGETVPDPHVWGDVQNVVTMVEAIRDELTALSPEDSAVFQANADAYIAKLERLDAWVSEQIATIPPDQRQLVTTHDAFAYYANAYGLEVTGTLIGISTEEQPSAQTVQQLVESIRTLNVPAIFAETTINPTLIETVAQEAEITLADQELYSDSLGAAGSNGETYIQMIVANTEAIVTNLGGTVTPFEIYPITQKSPDLLHHHRS
jgi:manganese/iron transport system substrate-binding protein